MYIDDCINAIIKLAELQFCGSVNVSSNTLTSIKDLANILKAETNFEGSIKYDQTKLSGQSQRIMDSSKMAKLGWNPETTLSEGIKKQLSGLSKIENILEKII